MTIKTSQTGLRAIALAATMAITAMATTSHAQDAAPAPQMVLAFEETVTLADGMPVGQTPLGIRNIVPITGGTFWGPGDGPSDAIGIKGTIVPGGWDWQLAHGGDCGSIKADYMLKTDDGAIINVINAGNLCRPAAGEKMKPGYTSPVFEAPLGKYDWLNKSAFIGTLEPAMVDGKPAVHIRFYRAQ